jgi:hypothetical protein
MEKIYKGDVKITEENQKELAEKLKGITKISGNLDINSETKLEALTSIGGNLYIYSDTKLEAPLLTSVGGYLYINSETKLEAPLLTSVGGYLYIKIKNEKLEKQLWSKNSKNKWYLTENSSDWLFEQNGNFEYKIKDVTFTREWYEKILKDKLTAEEVFAIDNIEHRRIAYEYMDKTKMKSIKDFKVLDEGTDSKGNPHKVVSFTIQNMSEPLKFYNCFCPNTMREYFLGTDKSTCSEAKNSSFGLSDVEFVNEW